MNLPIPLTYLNNKKFSYITLSCLLLNSNRKKGDQFRYIKQDKITPYQIFKGTSLSKPTAKTKLDYLLQGNEVVEVKEGAIYLYKGSQYVQIESELLELLIKELDETHLRFYITLMKYKSLYKNIFPSLQTIADEIGLSRTNRNNLGKYPKNLADKGFITLEQKRFSGIKTKNFYTLLQYNQIVSKQEDVIEESVKDEPVKEKFQSTTVINPIVKVFSSNELLEHIKPVVDQMSEEELQNSYNKHIDSIVSGRRIRYGSFNFTEDINKKREIITKLLVDINLNKRS